MQPLPQQPRIRNIALLALSVLAIGVVFYHRVEGWSFIDSLYFCVVTLATVGYGDLTPTTPSGRLFTIFYIAFGIAIFAASINYLIKHAVSRRMQNLKNHEQDKKDKKPAS